MGRRTARGAVVAAALCALVGTGPGGGSEAVAAQDAYTYDFAEGAQSVEGAASTTDAVGLEPGGTYRSTLPVNGRLYFRLALDATSNAYVSATAVPRHGTTVSSSDGVQVAVQDTDARSCSYDSTRFGASRSPHPVAAWASRVTDGETTACQTAGTYYMVVERIDSAGSSSADWDLELTYTSEPGLVSKAATTAPESPGDWNSASPDPLTGDAVHREGGAGFATAAPLGEGVWQDDLTPGQTRFYRVPVDWGQQLHAVAELGSSSSGSSSGGRYVSSALVMSLYNPARGYVDDESLLYGGRQSSAALDPLPPVAYANRYGLGDRMSGMRFAGSYYLVVHLAEGVTERFGAGPYGLTLRVQVTGTTQDPPGYLGQSVPRDTFAVTEQDREAAAGLTSDAPAGGAGNERADGIPARGADAAMRVVAVSGIGAGSVLVLGLGLWTMIARRRAHHA
ncbi:hypothetical protein ACOT81_23700 [Streptomyces sp. WI04-05B]|uniref:hypothetical protein n=1 Tax=Streptomyces TaxID=1883 RepID=UPI0029B26D6E|nr:MULTISPECIES: hypothetical protein [unclassified Streptomyces]MDX2542973.1 hypothetical protein [Streptomyces sp. WI04-05B]MDX2589449.1 hypothetical protein [Streptomyces sp. WI04-05A]